LVKQILRKEKLIEKDNITWLYLPGCDAGSDAVYGGLCRAGTTGITRGTDSNHANACGSNTVTRTTANSNGTGYTDATDWASCTSYAGSRTCGGAGTGWRAGVHRAGPARL